MKYDFDAIVIGAGSGGLTSAIGLSKVGKKVLLVERDKMGGECTNTGCIPSKTLIHHARNFAVAQHSAGETDKLKAYKEKIFDLVRAKIRHVRSEESPEILEKKHGIKVCLGEASFQDSHTVLIKKKMDHVTYTAKYIVIASGSSARKTSIKGLPEEKLLTNENIFDLLKQPRKLLIIGGGPIGAEMAQAFTHLGTKVTIVNKYAHLLPREEPEISEETQRVFEKQGMTLFNSSTVNRCEGRFAIVEEKKSKAKTVRHKVEYDYILLAIGRVPNTSSLNLDAACIKCNGKGIVVDKHYRTSQKNIFAVGDVSSAAKFTHVADDQGRYVVKRILFPLYRSKRKKPLPRVTYLNEEVASVGITYKEALKRYSPQEITKITLPYGATDRANTDEAKDGVALVVAKRLTGKILGASLMGRNAGELISVFTLAIQQKISLFSLNALIVPYPVLGSLYKKLSDTYIGQTFAHLKKDLKFAIKKQLPKLIAIIFWIVLLITFYRYKLVNDLSSLDLAKQVYEFVTGTVYGPFLYIIIYALRPVIFFPATLLTLISGALFGFWIGVFYTIIGENLSANLAYGIGRYLGQDFCRVEEGDSGVGLLSTWGKELRENSFVSVLIMRFIYLPFDLVNYGCGLLCVRWPAYFLATFIGVLPGLITFVSFGATIENIESFSLTEIGFNPMQLAISLALFATSLVIARLIQNHRRKQKMEPANASAAA